MSRRPEFSEQLQGTAAWRAARRGHLTCSALSVVAYGGARAWRRLLADIRSGTEPQLDHLPAIRRGRELEAEARAQYELAADVDVELAGFLRHPTVPRFGGSPDGLVGRDGGVEFKCPASLGVHAAWRAAGGVPDEHWPQVAGLLLVTGREWWDFVSYYPEAPGSQTLHRVRYHRDQDTDGRLSRLHARIREFCFHLLAGTSPADLDQPGPAPMLFPPRRNTQ